MRTLTGVAVEIPLFPLGAVLFPHTPLTLHIFEERYRAMLRDCAEEGIGFGVVAIAEGHEVGAPAKPHGVGTLAQVLERETLDDGSTNLIVAGTSRFRIEETSDRRAYPLGRVTWLTEEPGAPVPELERMGRRAARAFTAYAARMRRLAGLPESPPEITEDPERLSYLISAALQIETVHKQRLLETPTTAGRLDAALELLRREELLLGQMLAGRQARGGLVSPN